jgi:uncharacterized membrane protein
MSDRNDLFEMRRLEALSNTIFGIAMTLLAYDLPRAAQFAAAPSWDELFRAFGPRFKALLLSFIVAGLFWLSHHRRLVAAPHGTRWVVYLNLLFLMSIIFLPATNSLYGAYSDSSVIAVTYGVHLTTIAVLNMCLWLLAVGPGRPQSIAAMVPVAVLFSGAVVSTVSPVIAGYIWFMGFAAPLTTPILQRFFRT